MTKLVFIAALAATLFTFASAAPTNKHHLFDHAFSIKYKQFNGDGSTTAGWPDQSDWVDFEKMFDANKLQMSTSCAQYNQTNNSPQEIQDIKKAILDVSNKTSVDNRFILAVVMQESKGCVRVPTTSLEVANPGLMQDHGGSASCNEAASPQNPCPASEIQQMISDGAVGTSTGPGLQQLLKQASSKADDPSTVQHFYVAARLYNSGTVASSGDLGQGLATHCYSSDIANRLIGWTSQPDTCDLDKES